MKPPRLALIVLIASATPPAAAAAVTAHVSAEASDAVIELERDSGARDGVRGGFALAEVMAPLAVAGDRGVEAGLVTLYLRGDDRGGVPPLRAAARGVHAVAARAMEIERPPGAEPTPPPAPGAGWTLRLASGRPGPAAKESQ